MELLKKSNPALFLPFYCPLPPKGGFVKVCLSISPLLRLRVAATAEQGRGFRGKPKGKDSSAPPYGYKINFKSTPDKKTLKLLSTHDFKVQSLILNSTNELGCLIILILNSLIVIFNFF